MSNSQEMQQIKELTQMLTEMDMANMYSDKYIVEAVRLNPGNNQQAIDSLLSGEVEAHISN